LHVTGIEQSNDAVRRNASRAALAYIQRESRVIARYISRRDIDSFIHRARKFSWVNVDALRYALTGNDLPRMTYGASCNVAMLANSVDSLIVNSSTRCNLVDTPGGGSATQYAKESSIGKFTVLAANHEAVSFFDSLKNAESHLHQSVDTDLFGDIEQALCHAGAVSLGAWGGLGFNNPAFAALVKSADNVTPSYFGHRAALAPTIGATNMNMHAFGLHASSIAMPFLPIEEGDGGIMGQSLFGVMLRNGYSSKDIYALPSAVKLLIKNTDVPMNQRNRISVTDFFAVLISSFGPGDAATLGRRLLDAAKDVVIEKNVIGTWCNYLVDAAKNARHATDATAIQVAADDIESAYENKTIEQSSLLIEIIKFGNLLVAWPGLVAAMGNLRQNGIWLGDSP